MAEIRCGMKRYTTSLVSTSFAVDNVLYHEKPITDLIIF